MFFKLIMMKILSVLLVKVIGVEGSIDDNCWSTVDRRLLSIDTSFSIDMTMSLYLFLDMYLTNYPFQNE